MNSYDPCAANKMINGKQMTVAWHIDNLKVSHKQANEVTGFVNWLKTMCEDKENGIVKATRGKVHECLGMTLDFQKKGAVKIKMLCSVKSMAENFAGKLKEKVTTPAVEHLLKVNLDCEKLDEQRAKECHCVAARGLHVSQRSRADVEPTMAHVCTRVSDPDEDDWKKLCRLMSHLKDMLDSCPTLRAD